MASRPSRAAACPPAHNPGHLLRTCHRSPTRSFTRTRFLLCLLSLSLLLATACARPGEGSDGRTVLRVTTWASQEELAIMERSVELFEAVYPEVDVRHEPVTVNYKEKIMISLAGGAPPDVMLLDSDDMPAFVDRGLLLNLAPYARRVGLDLDLFYPHVLAIGQRGEALYAWPKDFTPMVIYYNRDLLEAAGVAPEGVNWTRDEFLAAARAVRRDSDGDGEPEIYGAYIGRYFYAWQPWIWAGGGAVFSPDGTRAVGYTDSEAVNRTITFLTDLRLRYALAPRPEVFRGTSGMVQNLFYIGRVAMIESGHWWLPKLGSYVQDGRVSIGVANIPHAAGQEPVTVMYESGWAVPVGSRHRQWAIRLAAFLADEECQRLRGELGLAIPAMPHIAEEIVRSDPWGIGDAFLQIIPTARPSRGTQIDNYRVAARQLEEIFDRVYARGEAVPAATAAVAPKVEAALAPRPGTRPGADSGPGSGPGSDSGSESSPEQVGDAGGNRGGLRP